MKDGLSILVLKQKASTPKPKPKYWQAVKNNLVIDENNSIALLKSKWAHYWKVTFKPKY